MKNNNSKEQQKIGSKNLTNHHVKNYILFEDLQNFQEEEDLIELAKKISNLIKVSENWNNNMEAINLLRRLNKYKRNFFFGNFDAHYKYISTNYLNSHRSCLVKITLMLIGEIFNFTEKELDKNSKSKGKNLESIVGSFTNKFPEWINTLIPVIIKKYVLDKNFIQEEAKIALNNFTKNFQNTDALLTILKNIQDKNLKFSSRAYELFMDFIEEIDTEKLIKEINWELCFKEFIEISKLKKDPYPKKLKNIFSILHKKLGIENLEKITNDMKNLQEFLNFSKSEIDSFTEISNKFILEENGTSKKSKGFVSLQEHIKSLKNSENLEKEKFEENYFEDCLILEKKSKNINEVFDEKEKFEETSNNKKSKVPIPVLVLKSSKKIDNINEENLKKDFDAKGSNENEKENEQKGKIKENLFKKLDLLKDYENDKDIKSNTSEKNELREKDSIDVEIIRRSTKKQLNEEENNLIK